MPLLFFGTSPTKNPSPKAVSSYKQKVVHVSGIFWKSKVKYRKSFG